MIRPGALAVAAALACASPALARGPSFDCARAVKADEKAICASPALAAQDAQMARLYAQVQACSGMGSKDVNNSMQGAWLRRRAACGGNAACIGKLYRARIAHFAPRAAKARRFEATHDCPGPV